MDNDQDSLCKAIAFFVMMISYGVAFFISIIWIGFLPNVCHGFRDLKAEVVIGGIFQLSWMFSNLFALLGYGMLLIVYSKLRWFGIVMIVVQLILYFCVRIFVG